VKVEETEWKVQLCIYLPQVSLWIRALQSYERKMAAFLELKLFFGFSKEMAITMNTDLQHFVLWIYL
jgi:hypothetical protein